MLFQGFMPIIQHLNLNLKTFATFNKKFLISNLKAIPAASQTATSWSRFVDN
jgi:hypothetical protein